MAGAGARQCRLAPMQASIYVLDDLDGLLECLPCAAARRAASSSPCAQRDRAASAQFVAVGHMECAVRRLGEGPFVPGRSCGPVTPFVARPGCAKILCSMRDQS